MPTRKEEGPVPLLATSASLPVVDLLVLAADDAEARKFAGAGTGQPWNGLVARPASRSEQGRRGLRSAATKNLLLARRDVAQLNQRARERLRALGRIGPDRLHAGPRVFAAGDRVIARRNDRRLGVINGDAGRLTAIDAGRLNVELSDGRNLELPAAYAHAGHLDHGYALTAHLAQGSTVDRAFVLGSDELYRAWGYTALSRHRAEARRYVSGTPDFLNQAVEPLQPGSDVSGAVARMLSDSRAQHVALDGLPGADPGTYPVVSRAIDRLASLHIWPERPKGVERERGVGIER
ncbi:MAG TPA: hypothetical protein VE220_03850 [Gaiellaceae bacterium]|nr:hypothetical protein [Gaiellaceae bacterium]